MDVSILRSWWATRQGLDGSLEGQTPAAILDRSGWARSVGGAAPYLTMWSRGSCTREVMDAAAAKCEIHELPAARGCTYVIPACDFALALQAGVGFGLEQEMKVARKLGVTDAEIDKLCDAILKALTVGALDPDSLREATGGASRSLGEEGKKKGITTTLPLGLGKLQVMGEIRRVPTNGRLDQQRYKYTLWKPNPLAKRRMDPDEVNVELARRYFRWIGPASMAEFQGFSGLGVKVAKAAIEPLGLVAFDETKWMFPEELESLQQHRVSKTPCYKLTSSLDAMTLLRRDHRSLIDPAHLEQKVFLEKDFGTLGGLADLPSHAIYDRGRLVGLWEFDSEAGDIAWFSFERADKKLLAAVAEAEEFVRTQLGDARSFSLDSPKSRVPKIKAIRGMAKR